MDLYSDGWNLAVGHQNEYNLSFIKATPHSFN